jgi:hypothetical protein
MSHRSEIVLLAIRGTLVPRTLEEARKVHNETAGNEQGVAAAKSLGDLTHNVYVPLADGPGKATELLILDLWNNPPGLRQFFADPQVQHGGSLMFSGRDSAVFVTTEECASYALPTPVGKNERFVGLLRATVKSRSDAAAAFNAIVKSSSNAARKLGQVSHEVFYRMTPPGEHESLELLAVDTWMDGAGMQAFYADPDHLAPLKDIFAGPPATSMWRQPPGAWIEW